MSSADITAIIDGRTGELLEASAEAERLEERRAYAERVRKTLKYEPLAQAVSQETVATPADVVLLKALQTMGVRPLDPRSVHYYKRSKSRNLLNYIAKGFGLPIMFAGLLASAIVVIAAFNSPAVADGISVHWIWGAILGGGSFLVWIEHAFIPRSEWRETRLEHFTAWSGAKKSALLPREVLDIVLEAKALIPNVQAMVHSLEHQSGPWFKILDILEEALPESSADPDPFLELRFGGESYFVAVWDEAGFDGRLMRVE